MSYSEFCRQTVQQYVPDLYMLSLMAKSDAQRKALWALFAFYHEIAKTRTVVSEPTLGLIRLQWWRDELDKFYNGSPIASSEILTALTQVIQDYNLPKTVAESMLAAHEQEIRQTEPPRSIEDALVMIDDLHVPLCRAIFCIAGKEDAALIDKIARNRGLIDVLYRAQPNTIIRQEQAKIVEAFDPMLKPSSRMGKAINNQAQMVFKHMLRYGFDPYNPRFHHRPACEAWRLWTSLWFC